MDDDLEERENEVWLDELAARIAHIQDQARGEVIDWLVADQFLPEYMEQAAREHFGLPTKDET